MKPVTSPILFPAGQQKEVELRLNYISKVEIITTQSRQRYSQLQFRLVHLDVEDTSEELLAPALLCHKEPARRIQSPLLGHL